MFQKLWVVWTIPELRQKIILTLILLTVFRLGQQIHIPFLDEAVLNAAKPSGGIGQWFNQAALLSAAEVKKVTIFGLGIMPYISASIILQLLSSVWKPLEELKKEGEVGRKKINEYTRYLTVVLCLIQCTAYLISSIRPGDGPSPVLEAFRSSSGGLGLWWVITGVLMMTAGTVFLMWIGEQIDEYGIGNGISLLIMAGIVGRMPLAITDLMQNFSPTLTRFQGGKVGIETIVLLVALFMMIVFGVVFMTLARREIATQSAKHVRGRRVFGGNKQFFSFKINQSGVMPIIFASSLLLIPSMLLQLIASGLGPTTTLGNLIRSIGESLSAGNGFLHNLLYVALIYFFCYFWTAITFNPQEIAENLKEHGTFIPGYRPGKLTARHLENVMMRITYVGAAFLAIVAIVPTIIYSTLGISQEVASFYGGTGLLIAVSVAFDLVQKIDSHLVMRNYRGLLEQ